MIVRRPPEIRRDAATEAVIGPGARAAVSDAGGLQQFGVFVDRLDPGAMSSTRHWHSAEDEMLFVLEGQATVIDDDGAQEIGPGDAAVWRKGQPNGHHVLNRSGAPLRYVIAGSRVAGDICTYPDSGDVQVNGQEDWHVQDGTGQILRGGPLPPHLRDLPADWGTPFDPALPARRIQRAADREWVEEPPYTHPALNVPLGAYAHAVLGDPGGLTQFGVHLERLPPGSESSYRHWHEAEDEMILVLSGNPTLVEEAETDLAPGDAACWPAGVPTGHRLVNRSDAPAVYLTIGTRLLRDVIHYTDHDLITHKDGAARRYLRRDGTEIGRKP